MVNIRPDEFQSIENSYVTLFNFQSEHTTVFRIDSYDGQRFNLSYYDNNLKKTLTADPYDTILLEKTLGFASYYHGGQKRKYANLPYIIHPVAVSHLVASFTVDQYLIKTALLHDSAEDCDCTIKDIEEEFGPSIAKMVDGCTNPSQVIPEYTKLKRAERKRIDLEHIIKNPEVHLVKAMDIYHNMFTSIGADRYYMKNKVVPEKTEVLANLVIPNDVKNLVQSSLDMVMKL